MKSPAEQAQERKRKQRATRAARQQAKANKGPTGGRAATAAEKKLYNNHDTKQTSRVPKPIKGSGTLTAKGKAASKGKATYGKGSAKVNSAGKANVSKEQLAASGHKSLTAYMNAWNKSGKRPGKASGAKTTTAKASTPKAAGKTNPATGKRADGSTDAPVYRDVVVRRGQGGKKTTKRVLVGKATPAGKGRNARPARSATQNTARNMKKAAAREAVGKVALAAATTAIPGGAAIRGVRLARAGTKAAKAAKGAKPLALPPPQKKVAQSAASKRVSGRKRVAAPDSKKVMTTPAPARKTNVSPIKKPTTKPARKPAVKPAATAAKPTTMPMKPAKKGRSAAAKKRTMKKEGVEGGKSYKYETDKPTRRTRGTLSRKKS